MGMQTDTVMEIPHLLSIPEAAGILDVSRNMVYKYIKRGRLNPVLVGGRQHLLRQEVEGLRAARRQSTPQ